MMKFIKRPDKKQKQFVKFTLHRDCVKEAYIKMISVSIIVEILKFTCYIFIGPITLSHFLRKCTIKPARPNMVPLGYPHLYVTRCYFLSPPESGNMLQIFLLNSSWEKNTLPPSFTAYVLALDWQRCIALFTHPNDRHHT